MIRIRSQGIFGLAVAFGLLVSPMEALPQTPPSALPAEVDTVQISGDAILANVRGAIFRKVEGGHLVPLSSGAALEPGDMLLVTRGASFAIGSTTFGPESYGDRRVRFQ